MCQARNLLPMYRPRGETKVKRSLDDINTYPRAEFQQLFTGLPACLEGSLICFLPKT